MILIRWPALSLAPIRGPSRGDGPRIMPSPSLINDLCRSSVRDLIGRHGGEEPVRPGAAGQGIADEVVDDLRYVQERGPVQAAGDGALEVADPGRVVRVGP